MSKMASKLGAWCGLAVALTTLAACGGSAPPPQAPESASAASLSSDTSSSDKSSPSEAAPSAESAAGVKAFDAGNYAEARKSFEAATKKNPNDFDSFYNLGMACEKLGDTQAAEVAYKGALAVKPDLDTASTALSSLYLDGGRTDDALAVARAGLAKHNASAPLHENVGIALAMRGDQDGATKEFSQAVQLTPSEPMLHLTFAHWLNVWHVRGAAAHLATATDLVKDDYGMLAAIGLEYRMASEFDSCIKTFDHAIAIKDGGEVRTERALCRHGLKDEKGMLVDLQAAVEKEPSYAPAHYYLAGRLAADKHFKEASAEYAKYLQLEPNGSLAKPATDKMKALADVMAKKK